MKIFNDSVILQEVTDTINHIMDTYFNLKDSHPEKITPEVEEELADIIWRLNKLDYEANILSQDVEELLIDLERYDNDNEGDDNGD